MELIASKTHFVRPGKFGLFPALWRKRPSPRPILAGTDRGTSPYQQMISEPVNPTS